MNSWKIVWDAYYEQATRRALLREFVRLSGWPARILFVLSAIAFLVGSFDVVAKHERDFPWLMAVGELGLFAIFEHVRTTKFATVYGSTKSDLGPAENEDQRGHRFLMFKRNLQRSHLNRSHINDLFRVVAAKEELEEQHNVSLNRFVIFMSGVLTSAGITLIRDLQAEEAAWALFWIGISGLILAPVFWVLPTRKGKLKELKYFMVLYCAGSE